jgi:uncharacterized membrane protein YcaP (DUF421 family)
LLISAIRTIIIYVAIVIALRVMGKRQLGELRPSELVVALLIADLAAVPMQGTGIPLLHGLIPMLVLIALEIVSSVLMMKWPFLERLVSGNPVPVISDGKLDRIALKRLRLSVDDLMEALRQQNCFDVSEVDYAVAEPGGQITVFLKPAYRPATVQDVTRPPKDTGMPAPVITDGAFCPWGVELCEKSEQKISAFLIRRGLTPKEVFLMTLSREGAFFILTVNGHTIKGEERF